MLKLLTSIILFISVSLCSLASNPFKKEHHFQISSKIPFNFETDSETDKQIYINGIPIKIPDGEKTTSKTYKSPTLNMSYLFMPRRWFAFGVTASWGKKNGHKDYILLPFLNHKYNENNIALKTDFKFFLLNRKYFDIYSSISIGALYKIKTKEYDKFTEKEKELVTAIDFSFIGFSFGNKLYGLAEWQGVVSGVKVGLGYKF